MYLCKIHKAFLFKIFKSRKVGIKMFKTPIIFHSSLRICQSIDYKSYFCWRYDYFGLSIDVYEKMSLGCAKDS